MTDKKRKPVVNMQQVEQRAKFAADSANDESRTIDVVWSTAQKIRFYSYELGEHFLTLGLEPDQVRLDFMNAGAPVLDTHASYSVEHVKGRVADASVNGTEGRATLRFSMRDEVTALWADVRDGILPFVSVGTRLHKLSDISEDDDKIPHYLAVDHEPLEISIAPIPKDTGARMQSESGAGDTLSPCIIQYQSSASAPTQEGPEMEPKKKAQAKAAPVVEEKEAVVTQAEPVKAEPKVDVDDIRKQAVIAERERATDIRTAVITQAKMPAEFAEELIAQGVSVADARIAVLTKMADADEKVPTIGGIVVIADEGENRVQAISNALEHRTFPGQVTLSEHGRDFVGLSMLEIAREVLQSHGVKTRGIGREKIAEQALHATADFPLILSNTAGKTLQRAYEEAGNTFGGWARETSAADFKAKTVNALGEAPNLAKVNESGEFTRGTIGEKAESYKLETYGKILGFSRQALINDDLGAFLRLSELYGRAAARLEGDVVYGVITTNANMSDGVAMFHATHKNLEGAGAISVVTLGAARKSLRLQTGISAVTLNLTADYLLVPAALETVAENYITQSIVGTKASDTNPFVGKLQLVVEPRLDADSATKWYVLASPSQIDTVEYCYLDGQRGVFLENRQGFDVDGVEFKARLDFAAKAIDHRGMLRNG